MRLAAAGLLAGLMAVQAGRAALEAWEACWQLLAVLITVGCLTLLGLVSLDPSVDVGEMSRPIAAADSRRSVAESGSAQAAAPKAREAVDGILNCEGCEEVRNANSSPCANQDGKDLSPPAPTKAAPCVPSGGSEPSRLRCYTIEEVRQHDSRSDCWIVIEDRVYDVTRFAYEHPGGPLTLWGVAGRDATDPFLAFHPRGTEKRLRPMLVGCLVGYKPKEVVREFRKLRQSMIDVGIFRVDRAFYVRKFTLQMGLLVMAVLFVAKSGRSSRPWAWTLPGAAMLGLFFQQLAGIGHDVGHNSVLHWRWADRMLGLVVGNLLTGISIGWWKKSHNTHHVVTNSIEYDPDIQLLPVFAVSERYFYNVFSRYHDWTLTFNWLSKLIVSYQHVLYPVIMSLARFNLYAQSVFYVCGLNAHTHPVRWRSAEVATLAGFWAWMVCLLRLLPGWDHVVVFLLVSHAVAGLLHVQITISHFCMGLYDGRAYRHDDESWVHTQLATTMDVDCPEWLDWFHIGLQFQAEHHLFPRVPRHNLRKVQQLLMEFCSRHGIRHRNVTWLKALYETYECLRDVALKARKTDPKLIRLKESILYAGLQAEG